MPIRPLLARLVCYLRGHRWAWVEADEWQGDRCVRCHAYLWIEEP